MPKKTYKQTGKTTTKADKQKRGSLPGGAAKKPGWRISKSGKKYFEARKNRSDKNRKKRL